jgi:hypothetical protein
MKTMTQHRHDIVAVGLDEVDRDVETGADLVRSVLDRPELFDLHTVDLADLSEQEPDVVAVRKLDGEFVHRAMITAFENLDPHHIATHRPDTTCHLPERARAVGHPHTYDEGLHGRRS